MKRFSKLLALALIVTTLLSMSLTSCGFLFGSNKESESVSDSADVQDTSNVAKPEDTDTSVADDSEKAEDSDESDVVEDSDSDADSDTETETETETEAPLAELDVVDLDGRTFTMLWPEYISAEGHFRHSELGLAVGAEMTQGDIIETAIFQRNEMVQTLYNAEIEVNTIRYSEIVDFVRNEFNGSTSSYDVIATMNTKMSVIALEGMLTDFNDLEYYDEDQQWWNHDLMQSLSIVNRRYFGLGDIIYSDDLYPYVVYVNTEMAKSVGIQDDFYDLVYTKEWTLEKFHTLAKKAVADGSGDGTPATSIEDIYGAVDGKSFARALYYSAGKSVITFDDQGYPVWQMDEAHGHAVLSRIIDMWHTGNAVVDVTQLEEGKSMRAMDIINMFNSNQMLFMPGDQKAAQAFTSVDNALDDFALLPIPLWEDGSDYICVMNEAVVLGIPVMAKDQDEISLILSAMGRESIETLTPAFFEVVLTNRYMKNADSVKTLELILSSIVPRDIADIQGWGGFMDQFCKLVIENNTNFSSYYSENISVARGKMDEYITTLEGLDK